MPVALFLILWLHGDFLGCDIDHSVKLPLRKGCKRPFLDLSPGIAHKIHVSFGIWSQESENLVTSQGIIINKLLCYCAIMLLCY